MWASLMRHHGLDIWPNAFHLVCRTADIHRDRATTAVRPVGCALATAAQHRTECGMPYSFDSLYYRFASENHSVSIIGVHEFSHFDDFSVFQHMNETVIILVRSTICDRRAQGRFNDHDFSIAIDAFDVQFHIPGKASGEMLDEKAHDLRASTYRSGRPGISPWRYAWARSILHPGQEMSRSWPSLATKMTSTC
jgi:hypothetical protein